MPLLPKHVAAIIATLSLLGAAALADDLSPAEERGKLIYTKGESTSRRVIRATVATSQAPASASILPCVQCHGVDGRGRSVCEYRAG